MTKILHIYSNNFKIKKDEPLHILKNRYLVVIQTQQYNWKYLFYYENYLLYVCIQAKFSKSHKDTEASAEPTAKYLPLGANSIQIHVPGWALTTCRWIKSGKLQ